MNKLTQEETQAVSNGNTPSSSRRSPRLAVLFKKQIAGKSKGSKKKLFVDISDNEEEVFEQTQQTQSTVNNEIPIPYVYIPQFCEEAQPTQASVAENMLEQEAYFQGATQASVDNEEKKFNHDFWVEATTQASVVEDIYKLSLEYQKSDEFVVQLPNIEEGECHPDEDINNVPGYEQKFKDDMEYKKFLKKVENGCLSDKGSDSESESDNDVDSVDGDPEFGEVEVENDKQEDHYGDLLDSESEKEPTDEDEHVGVGQTSVEPECSGVTHDNSEFEKEYADHFKEEDV
ncbi:uncharacterized protein LOC113343846 [Papaver somniferum]|uniref:uncharacterized protein LOC113343846 n=1 Tax=Papaver somniferum TaxID=3469 RepID=UPI000E6FE688|nr:uncharacterized protein LOC113343846 [Papaver somniferum]